MGCVITLCGLSATWGQEAWPIALLDVHGQRILATAIVPWTLVGLWEVEAPCALGPSCINTYHALDMLSSIWGEPTTRGHALMHPTRPMGALPSRTPTGLCLLPAQLDFLMGSTKALH